MRNTLSGAMLCLAVGVVPGTVGANAERGQMLYENHCLGCHESVVHVRERREAATLAALRHEVVRWKRELALEWGAEEIDDVAEYLNVRFYNLTP